MNRNNKIKPAPKTFYVCNQQNDCHGSGLCGKQCHHTTNVQYAKYKKHTDFKVMANGDKFEKISGSEEEFMIDTAKEV